MILVFVGSGIFNVRTRLLLSFISDRGRSPGILRKELVLSCKLYVPIPSLTGS